MAPYWQYSRWDLNRDTREESVSAYLKNEARID